MSVDAAGHQALPAGSGPAGSGPAGSVFSLGWLMAQINGPLQQQRAIQAPARLPAVTELGQEEAMELAFAELERLLGPYPDLSGASLATAWAATGHADFPAAVAALHLAILEHFVGDHQQLSAYQLGQALSDTCWLPDEDAGAELFLGQFGRQRLAMLQLWLAGASGVLPPLAAVTVSRSLQNWQDWADSYASMIKGGWATLRRPVAAALQTQAAAWHGLLGSEMDTGGQTSVDAWVQASRSMVRTARQLTLTILRHFWLIVAVIAAATGGLLYLAITDSSGTAKVWTSLATVAAAFGITGVSLRAAAIRAATGMEQDICRAASFDARAWGATWLPTVPQGRLQRHRLASRGVAAPHARNGLEMAVPPVPPVPPVPVAAPPGSAAPETLPAT